MKIIIVLPVCLTVTASLIYKTYCKLILPLFLSQI